MNKTNRSPWIDNAKFLAISCVIIGHSFSTITGGFKGYDELNLFIVAFNMPLFALLSGITTFKSISKIHSYRELFMYFDKILWHIGVPTVVYTLLAMGVSYGMQSRFERSAVSFALLFVVCFCIFLLKFSKTKYRFKKLETVFPYLILPVCIINQSVWYFVYVIFSMLSASISSYLSNKINRFNRLDFLIIFLILSSAVSPISPFYSTLELYLPFSIGYIYASVNGLNPITFKSNISRITISGFFLILGIVFFLLYQSIDNQFYILDFFKACKEGLLKIILYRQISAICLSAGLIIMIQCFSRRYNLISKLGAISFGLYPIHAELIGIYKNYVPQVSNSPATDVLYVFFVALSLLVISSLLITVIKRSAYVNLILLGE